MLLKDKVAIVTGAAMGIGLATAARLSAEGAAVVMADIAVAELQNEADALAAKGRSVLAVKCDVAKREDVFAMVRAAEEKFGRVDILVNNAGIAGRAAPLEEITDEDWERMMAIDLKSVYLCCQAVIAGMKARRYGRIINVASIAGKEGNPNMIPYSTAKAGVIGLTKALAKEVAQLGIYVNAISPAVIETPILQQVTPEQVQYMVQRIPMGRTGKPEEVAALICWLASDEASFTTGQCIDISGGRATY
ncbi:MAG TPA: SDR family NAD(P)-dependent oxidoreductase [Blastocatellia bacterium]|nr:SDR family NAD(P)-dependent oxidoreductase [Blastocatellia bacterium]